MSAQTWFWLALVTDFSVVLMVHILTVWSVLVRIDLRWHVRLIALIPPGAPVVAWRAGLRTLPLLWGISTTTYALLWTVL